jgi:hypothetical protein
MAIILKANKVNLFVSSVLFVFWYHSPNILDTPRIAQGMSSVGVILKWARDNGKRKEVNQDWGLRECIFCREHTGPPTDAAACCFHCVDVIGI